MLNQTLISVFSILIAATGISLVFKDYLASLLGGIILRCMRQVKPGVRIKVLIMPAITIKGDVIKVGVVRTTLHEVGDGERLPSVRTGRIVKVPNFTLVNSPLVIYGEQITDEVIAYETRPFAHLDTVEEDMRAAIAKDGHAVIDVGFYQKEDH
jgi:small-conductance mechanosensitive channel